MYLLSTTCLLGMILCRLYSSNQKNWSRFPILSFTSCMTLEIYLNLAAETQPPQLWHVDNIEGGKVETVTDFIFLGSKITANNDCSHEIRRCLLLGRKAVTNLGSVLKSRDTTLPAKVPIFKTVVFPVIVYGCGSWTIKKAECNGTDAFELCWRRLLRVPWDCKEIKPV